MRHRRLAIGDFGVASFFSIAFSVRWHVDLPDESVSAPETMNIGKQRLETEESGPAIAHGARAPPKITLELYAQAVSADQQKAHRKVVQMVLPANLSEQLKARSDAPTA